MQIIEVKTAKDRQHFLTLPLTIYKNDPNWVRPLDKDIEQVFDTEKNKFFRHGECTRWLLQDNTGKTIGRVAAFINKKLANKNDQPTGKKSIKQGFIITGRIDTNMLQLCPG